MADGASRAGDPRTRLGWAVAHRRQYLAEWWRSNLTDGAARIWLSGISAEGVAGWMQALGGQLLHRLFMFFITLTALFVSFGTDCGLEAACLKQLTAS